MKRISLLIIFLACASLACEDKEDQNPGDRDIHILGGRVADVGPSSNVYYWKNGNSTLVAAADQSFRALGFRLNNSEVFIGGNLFNNSINGPVYWTNGQFMEVSVLSDEAFALGLQFNNNTPYLFGREFLDGQGFRPAYWFNGQTEILAFDGRAELEDMAFENGVIHAAGEDQRAGAVNALPLYWRNNQLEALQAPDEQISQLIYRQMVVSGGNVYILADVTLSNGQDSEEGHIIWTNGVPLVIKADFNNYHVHGLRVENGNVYYCGAGEKDGRYSAFYYLNNQINIIESDLEVDFLSVIDMAIKDGDVYVIGNRRNLNGTSSPVLWINNESQEVNVGNGYFYDQIIVQ